MRIYRKVNSQEIYELAHYDYPFQIIYPENIYRDNFFLFGHTLSSNNTNKFFVTYYILPTYNYIINCYSYNSALNKWIFDSLTVFPNLITQYFYTQKIYCNNTGNNYILNVRRLSNHTNSNYLTFKKNTSGEYVKYGQTLNFNDYYGNFFFSSDGTYITSFQQDNYIRTYEYSTSSSTWNIISSTNLAGHSTPVYCLDSSHNYFVLFSGGRYATPKTTLKVYYRNSVSSNWNLLATLTSNEYFVDADCLYIINNNNSIYILTTNKNSTNPGICIFKVIGSNISYITTIPNTEDVEYNEINSWFDTTNNYFVYSSSDLNGLTIIKIFNLTNPENPVKIKEINDHGNYSDSGGGGGMLYHNISLCKTTNNKIFVIKGYPYTSLPGSNYFNGVVKIYQVL